MSAEEKYIEDDLAAKALRSILVSQGATNVNLDTIILAIRADRKKSISDTKKACKREMENVPEGDCKNHLHEMFVLQAIDKAEVKE